jgi:NAD(P)-dependent dehydrogenase (short-subunit alcohol dehydrogenase family)
MTPSHLTIITGASRGLGAALAAQRLREGHQVLGLARGSQPALVGLAATQHATLVQWPVDLANPGPVAAQLAAWLAARPGQATAGPAAMVQPSVPWPGVQEQVGSGVPPMIGVPSGVIGRRPHQNSPADRRRRREQVLTNASSVRRRAGAGAGRSRRARPCRRRGCGRPGG